MASKITAALALFAATASAQVYGNQSSLGHTCQIQDPLLSCPPQDPTKYDSCCVETFGGLLLATQFWSIYTGRESQGQYLPTAVWSLHGLWPDFCNGSYTQYCDLSRQYDPIPSPNTTTGKPGGTPVLPYTGPNIGTFLEPFGKADLLAYMNTYWIAQNQDNPGFWGHEFSKHATCFSTFNTACYGPLYRKHEEVVDFFETAIKYYRTFPTWDWLYAAGIEPSNKTTYSYAAINDALYKESGAVPYLGCSGPRYNNTAAGIAAKSNDTGFTQLSEVWYYQYALGRPQDGDVVHVNATIPQSNCARASGAINYFERAAISEKDPVIPY